MARIEPGLLDHLAVAAICALAYRDGMTPRAMLELLFRRAVDDEQLAGRVRVAALPLPS